MDLLMNTAALRDTLRDALAHIPDVSDDATRPLALLTRCPAYAETPLVASDDLAARAGVASVHLKDERARMGLGSFKALGAAYVIARDAEADVAKDRIYVTASAGNHGMSVAAGARVFGSRAVVYIADSVPESFAARLAAEGAEVRREGATYEDSLEAANRAAEAPGHVLLSDGAWEGYLDRPWWLMEGYVVAMDEAVAQMPEPPTHIFLQAGVGGLAAAFAARARVAWGREPRIVVVEPEAAPALYASMRAGAPVTTQGPESAMGRLDCKAPSVIALKSLARDADAFQLITEAEGAAGDEAAAEAGLPSTPSGAAGLAGLLVAKDAMGLGPSSRVLLVLSECAA